MLDLAAGDWFYRVRGLNQTQLKKVAMTWSAKVGITVAKPKFKHSGIAQNEGRRNQAEAQGREEDVVSGLA